MSCEGSTSARSVRALTKSMQVRRTAVAVAFRWMCVRKKEREREYYLVNYFILICSVSNSTIDIYDLIKDVIWN